MVSIFGTGIGIMIALASDIGPTPAAVLLFPGFLAGMIVARLLGTTAGVVAGAVSNGAAYGFLLYGWCRLAAALRRRIPSWFASVDTIFSTC